MQEVQQYLRHPKGMIFHPGEKIHQKMREESELFTPPPFLKKVPYDPSGDNDATPEEQISDEESSKETMGILDALCQQNETSRVEEIALAIGRLNPEKDFGGKGLPKMEAIHRDLDESVTTQEMREAWKAYKEKSI